MRMNQAQVVSPVRLDPKKHTHRVRRTRDQCSTWH